MQFASEMHLRLPRRCFSGPEERREAGGGVAIAEIGSSADFLDERDARSDARVDGVTGREPVGRANGRIDYRFLMLENRVPRVSQDLNRAS